MRPFLNALLYFPTREPAAAPADFDLEATQLAIETEDDERLDGWWIRASTPSKGHVLFCHGNGGNIGDRLDNARLLAEAGFDLLLFDYRGYGRSSGRPSEEGTYRDARAARSALLEQAGVEASRVLYLGESLGGAVALDLALEVPPRGLILQSAFTSVRDTAVAHYPLNSDDRVGPALIGEAQHEQFAGSRATPIGTGGVGTEVAGAPIDLASLGASRRGGAEWGRPTTRRNTCSATSVSISIESGPLTPQREKSCPSMVILTAPGSGSRSTVKRVGSPRRDGVAATVSTSREPAETSLRARTMPSAG